MKLENIKVGDQLYWYDSSGDRHICTVDSITGTWVVIANKHGSSYHHNFFRGKLVPKKKRRVIWVLQDVPGRYMAFDDEERLKGFRNGPAIKFIEAKDQS